MVFVLKKKRMPRGDSIDMGILRKFVKKFEKNTGVSDCLVNPKTDKLFDVKTIQDGLERGTEEGVFICVHGNRNQFYFKCRK